MLSTSSLAFPILTILASLHLHSSTNFWPSLARPPLVPHNSSMMNSFHVDETRRQAFSSSGSRRSRADMKHLRPFQEVFEQRNFELNDRSRKEMKWEKGERTWSTCGHSRMSTVPRRNQNVEPIIEADKIRNEKKSRRNEAPAAIPGCLQYQGVIKTWKKSREEMKWEEGEQTWSTCDRQCGQEKDRSKKEQRKVKKFHLRPSMWPSSLLTKSFPSSIWKKKNIRYIGVHWN